MSRASRPLIAVGALAALALVAASGCSSSGGDSPSSPSGGTQVTGAAGSTTSAAAAASTGPVSAGSDVPAAGGEPRVDLVAVAVDALEQQLGAPQRYFEVNATSSLVNVIIALNDGALAQTWLYLDGVLTSNEPQPAEGDTFTADQIQFDPDAVLSKVAADLPGSALDLFFVTAPGGTVQYRVVVTSQAGGQLIVQLAGDGDVIEVDADSG